MSAENTWLSLRDGVTPFESGRFFEETKSTYQLHIAQTTDNLFVSAESTGARLVILWPQFG